MHSPQCNPLISVVMSVHNASLDMLRLSIECILNQTVKDIEFIIVDDENSKEIIDYLEELGLNESRVYVIHNSRNLGLTTSLIKGVSYARGKYIARQDVDDLSKLSRLEKQVKYLEECENVVLLGTWYEVIDEQGNITKKKLPDQNNSLKRALYLKNPFCHASVMFRKSSYFAVGGYDQRYKTSQDLDLWFKLSGIGQLGIIEGLLVTRKLHPQSVSFNTPWLQVKNSFFIRIKYLNNGNLLINLAKTLLTTVFHAYTTFINNSVKERYIKISKVH